MNNLLDTHALIWFIEGDERLSQAAKIAIENSSLVNYVSIASLWEIAIKINLGKLELKKPFSSISDQIDRNNFQVLPITFQDTFQVSQLPLHHRDPFDRIIISQSITNGLTIISKDSHFPAYGIKTLW